MGRECLDLQPREARGRERPQVYGMDDDGMGSRLRTFAILGQSSAGRLALVPKHWWPLVSRVAVHIVADVGSGVPGRCVLALPGGPLSRGARQVRRLVHIEGEAQDRHLAELGWRCAVNVEALDAVRRSLQVWVGSEIVGNWIALFSYLGLRIRFASQAPVVRRATLGTLSVRDMALGSTNGE